MNSQREANRRYYEKNKEKLKQAAREHYWKNRDAKRASNKIWRANNKPLIQAKNKEWRVLNRKRTRELNKLSEKRQIARNPNFKARKLWRCRVWRVFFKSASGAETLSVLGCSPEQFRQHIYSHLHSGMTKDNYGDLWELDHIEPCYKFDCTNEEQIRACFHYTNYRPRLKKENQWNPNMKDRIVPCMDR